MKNLLYAIAFIIIISTTIEAQTTNQTPPKKHGAQFVDKNGDGYNDNAPDHDGDGIPNGLDPDYKGVKLQRNKFVDLNGDGINDNAGKGKMNGRGKIGYGARNGVEDGNVNGIGKQAGKNQGYRGGRK